MNWIKRCETCKWAHLKKVAKNKHRFQCRLSPPLASGKDTDAQWPFVESKDYCGKYETHDDERLVCPVCGFTCTHVRGVDTRGGANRVVIVVECENSHAWEMILRQHKGDTFVTYNQIPFDSSDES